MGITSFLKKKHPKFRRQATLANIYKMYVFCVTILIKLQKTGVSKKGERSSHLVSFKKKFYPGKSWPLEKKT